MTSIDDNASASSDDSMNRKIHATVTVRQLRLRRPEDSESDDDDDREGLPSVTNSHPNSIVTQHSNVLCTPRNKAPASPSRREIPAVAVVSVRSSPRLAARSQSSTTANKQKQQNRAGEGSLPDGLDTLTQRSKDSFHIVTDDSGISIATKVISPISGKEYNLLTTDLKAAQLRKLASNVGVKNHHRLKKEIICQMIAERLLDEVLLERMGIHPEKNVAKKTNSLCRLVNCLFSEKLIDRFLRLNDLHTRIDHETGQTYKKFWNDVHSHYHRNDDNANDEFGKVYGSDDADDDPILKALSVQTDIDLNDFINLTEEAIRKSLRDLVKVRAGVKKRMTESGTHSDSAWDFIQASLKDCKDGKDGSSLTTTMVTKDSAYYFYYRCNEYPAIDSSFQSFLDSAIKGSSEHIDDDDSDTSSITTPNNNVARGSQQGSSGRSRKSNKKRPSSASFEASIESKTDMLFQEMKRSNVKQESDSGKLVESSVLLGLMTSIKTKLEVAMYLKDHEKIGELTQQLDKYEQEYRQLQPNKNSD